MDRFNILTAISNNFDEPENNLILLVAHGDFIIFLFFFSVKEVFTKDESAMSSLRACNSMRRTTNAHIDT